MGKVIQLLTVLAALAAAQQGNPIEGTVVNAATQQPIRRADVVLTHVDTHLGRGRPLAFIETDAEGKFQVAKLPAGEYSLQIQRPGYQHKVFRVRMRESAVRLTIPLIPYSVVSGRVVDEENEPVQGAQVSALAVQADGRGRRRWNTVAVDTTNDRGEYRLWRLPAGRYLVRAQYRPSIPAAFAGGTQREAYLPTYFPGTAASEEASWVTVGMGAETAGIEVGLRKGALHSVQGVLELPPGAASRTLIVTLSPKAGGEMSYDQQTMTLTAGRAAFRFENVRSGAWNISAATLEGEPPLRGTLPVDVSGLDVAELAVPMQPAVQVKGKATIPGAATAQLESVSLYFDAEDPAISSSPARLDKDGAFSGHVAAAGRYRLRVQGRPAADAYLDAVRFGSQQVLGAWIDIPGGTTPPFLLEFKRGGGHLAGLIEDADPTEEYVAAVFPVDAGLRKAVDLWDSEVREGQFEFRCLRPGDYYVVALPFSERGQLNWPESQEALATSASRVRIEEGATIRLTLRRAKFDR